MSSPSSLSFSRFFYWLAVSFSVDIALYLTTEWVPANVSAKNQYVATALVAGVWVLLAMEWAYCCMIIGCQLMGCPLPLAYRHRHPLVSSSLAEFWGVRWNPIIGKLLQDSFYKPLRRLGSSRTLCIVGCFAGSATLHALPQFISTHDRSDTVMMALFFLGQGFLLLLERATLIVLGLETFFDDFVMPTAGGTQMRVHFQWLTEMLILSFIFLSAYCLFERHATTTLLEWSAIAGLLTVASMSFVFVQLTGDEGWQQGKKPASLLFKIIVFKLIGWFWTVGALFVMLPLFSIPVYHACDTFYPASFLTGPLLRTASRILSK